MKHVNLLVTLFILISFSAQTQVLIATNAAIPDTSAMLEVRSTNKGLLLPRLTTAQRGMVFNPVPGLVIFNTDNQSLEVYTDLGWLSMKSNLVNSERLLGGNGAEDICRVRETYDGGYILAITTNSSANGDVTGTTHGSTDAWIVKLNSSLQIVWQKLIGGNEDEAIYSIQQTMDGGYIVAGSSRSSANGDITSTNHGYSDCWISKLDAFGGVVWSKLYGSVEDEWAVQVCQVTDGGFVFISRTYASGNGDVTGTNHGGLDYWAVKLNTAGNIIWNKLLGGNSTDNPTCIQQTVDGGCILGGESTSSANGNVTGTNHGGTDAWVVKLDANGNVSWNKLLGGIGTESMESIHQTWDGGYLLAASSNSSSSGDVSGISHGDFDFWIIKLDGTGSIVWNKLVGGSKYEWAMSIRQVADGGFIVAGVSASSDGDIQGISHGSYDYWIVKFNFYGTLTLSKLFGGADEEVPSFIQQTSDGGYIIIGWSNSSESGDVTRRNHSIGGADCWILKVN